MATSVGHLLTSSKVNDVLTFLIATNTRQNQTITITFTINDGYNTYTVVRSVIALISAASYNITTDSTIMKLTNQTAANQTTGQISA